MLVFWKVIFPVLLIFASGFLLQRIFRLDIKPISTLAIYLLLPLLVFDTFYKEPLNGSFYQVLLATVLIMAAIILFVWALCFFARYNRVVRNALLLSTAFPNSGNFGIPVVLFAFGGHSLIYAMPLMIFHNVLMGTIGIYIAADGQGGAKAALKTVLSQPQNYAVVAGMLFAGFSIHIPGNIYQSISMVGNTAIPVIMVILGMQLANVSIHHVPWLRLGWVCWIRLIISPLIAWGICRLLHFPLLMSQVMIAMSAMPSAANTTMYAIQFNASPKFVSISTFVTTLLSVLTLTLILNFLM